MMWKKSTNFSLHIKISYISIKVTKCAAADTSKTLLFNWGQGYNTKRNLKSGKHRNHGNLLIEVQKRWGIFKKFSGKLSLNYPISHFC